jgi:DNA primase catalytic core
MLKNTDYVEILKSRVDIIDVAAKLGCLPDRKEGNRYQGATCPAGHGSDNGRCFAIWPEIQAFKCWSCKIKGDVISLVRAVNKCGFLEALDWLADHAGIPRFAHKDMSDDQRAAWEKEQSATRGAFEALTASAEFYHEQLLKDPEMLDHLRHHYGLNDETITAHRIGYATGDGLGEHLKKQGFSEKEIVSTGLFLKLDVWREFFCHRLTFPYWKSGQVVYMIGRKTTRTPENKYEQAKYKKLLTHTSERPHISSAIQNCHFFGEDSARGAEIIYVAEGVTDCLVMLQARYPTISPVTVRFRHEDVPKLLSLTRSAKRVYLVPDQEDNESGMKGATDTASLLEAEGRNVYIVELPRAAGIEKIDVTDFLRDSGKAAFDELVTTARTAIQIDINALTARALSALELQEALGPLKAKLSAVPETKCEAYLGHAKQALNLKGDFVKALRKEIGVLRVANQKKSIASNGTADESGGVIAEMNQFHAGLMNQGRFVVLNEIIDPIEKRPDITLSSVFDFRNRYLNTSVLDPEASAAKGNAVFTTHAEVWLKSKARRDYRGIVFAPGRDVPEYYNLWRGFAVKPKQGDWSLFRKHIREVICRDNNDIFQWVMCWLANLVQDPGGERPGTSIVLRGGQGVGKGAFVVNFGEILGSHFVHISNQWKALGRFNSYLKDALLVFLDEGHWTGDRTSEGVLKALVTERHNLIEPKGKDAFSVENHARVIMASNHDWIVPAGFDERRFCVLDVSGKRAGDHTYFNRLYHQMANSGPAAMLYDLLQMDLTGINLRQIPRTSGLLQQIEASMTSAQRWFFECLREGTIGAFRDDRVLHMKAGFVPVLHDDSMWPRTINCMAVYADYKSYCNLVGERQPTEPNGLGRALRKMVPKIKTRQATTGTRDREYHIPPLAECRKAFEALVSYPIKWGDEDDDTREQPEQPETVDTGTSTHEVQEAWEAL